MKVVLSATLRPLQQILQRVIDKSSNCAESFQRKWIISSQGSCPTSKVLDLDHRVRVRRHLARLCQALQTE